jgi:hypothetical protein
MALALADKTNADIVIGLTRLDRLGIAVRNNERAK